MLKQFSRYGLVGILNTAVHWTSFALLLSLGWRQATANLLAFAIAVSLSFLINSRFTFQAAARVQGYVLFVMGMGLISLSVGALGDYYQWPGLLTLVIFSAISVLLGFAWSRWVVFRPPAG